MTIRLWSLALACVFAGWVTVLAVMAVISDAAPGAIVFWPAHDFAAHLPPGAAITGAGRFWVAVAGPMDDLGLTLYRAGARLVLPAGLPGCLPLPVPE